jgi:hypothetical protein
LRFSKKTEDHEGYDDQGYEAIPKTAHHCNILSGLNVEKFNNFSLGAYILK